jgi:hypothetical protein
MRILLCFSLVLATSILTISCQKELSETINQRTSSADSTLIRKIISLDTTLPSGLDTMTISNFLYDDKKRLIQFELIDFTTLGSTAVDLRKFFYNSVTDSLPYKAIDEFTETSYHFKDTIFYFYNNGIVASDSIRFYSLHQAGGTNWEEWYSRTRKFINNGNTTTVLEKETDYLPGPAVCQTTTTVIKLFSNGNIADQQNTATGCTTGYWQDHIQYDNKINPVYQVDVHYPMLFQTWETFSAQKNNVIDSQFPGESFQASYSYRSDNYPLTSLSTNSNTGSLLFKSIYLYY